MTMNEQANAYLRNRVMTAKPEELRLMLIEGAIRFATVARDGLLNADYEAVYEGATQCQAILLELINSLDSEQAPELCNRLAGLYTFIYNRTVDAGHQRDSKLFDEAIELLEYERETWILLMQRLTEDRKNKTGAAVPANTPQEQDPSQDQKSGSFISLRG